MVEPARLYESPYTDHAPTGPDTVFTEHDVDTIVAILNTVKANAAPGEVAWIAIVQAKCGELTSQSNDAPTLAGAEFVSPAAA